MNVTLAPGFSVSFPARPSDARHINKARDVQESWDIGDAIERILDGYFDPSPALVNAIAEWWENPSKRNHLAGKVASELAECIETGMNTMALTDARGA